MTRLIDGDALEKAIYEWMPKDQETWMDSKIPPIENLVVSIMMTIQEQSPVEAIPIEWIEKRISEIGDVAPIVVGAFKGLIEVWKEEQEKTDKKKSYFPKGFFSKERPLAKGGEDETD